MFAPIFGSLGTWAIGLIVVAALMGLSFAKGVTYEGNRQLAKQAEAEAARKDIIMVAGKDVTKIVYRYIEKKKKTEIAHQVAVAEVIEHAKRPDPVSCWVAPERVSTIAKAWGVGPSPNSPGQAGAVQGAGKGLPSSEERKP
jgi:hypothetical protein